MEKHIRRMLGIFLAFSMLLSLASPVTSYALDTGDQPTAAAEENNTEPETEAPTEPETEAPTEPETEAPTEPKTAAPTEPKTAAPTEPKTAAPTEPKTAAPTEPKTAAPTEAQPTSMPSFRGIVTVNGVTVTVSADEGIFPDGAILSVKRVNSTTAHRISEAVQTENDSQQNVALSYAFDIKVLDADGQEMQPADGAKVTVSFEIEEVADRNLSTQVYHIHEDAGGLTAQQLNTTENGSTVTAETDGFSYYTVEFTYNSMQYVMEGDTSVPLSDVLEAVGLSGVVTEVSVSNEELFSVRGEAGTWMVYAHQAFSSEEWMKVTINGVEYEITVTDASLSPWTFREFGWGGTLYIYCPPGSMYSKFSAEKDGVTKVAYCLNHALASPGPSVKYQTETYPTTKHYKVATIICALGYPSNSVDRIQDMWGYDLTEIQAQQATQVAIGAAQKALAEGWTVDTTYNNYVGSRSGFQSVYDYSKDLCARALELLNNSSTASKYTIAMDVTNAMTNSKLAVTITPYRAYGQYKIVIKNLPSGTLLTTGQNTRFVESNGTLSTATNKAVSGTVTIRGLGGLSGGNVGKFTLSSIPKGSSDRSITVTATSFAKLAPTNDVEWGKSPDSSHQDMFIAGMAEGKTVTATKSATVPKLPVGSITVVKKDVKTGANLSGCVFGLKKWDGSKYVDTGKTATTGTDGKATFSNLTTDTTSTGKYNVYEKSAPSGYTADSQFSFSFLVGSGWYGYQSSFVSHQNGTITSGSVTASVNGSNKTILTVNSANNGTFGYDATVYQYDTPLPPPPPDTFSITMNKRDSVTGDPLEGAEYQLYAYDSSGAWTLQQTGTVNGLGSVAFTGLHASDSANGTFRIVESAMVNSEYQMDSTFEAIVNPSTGEWSYAGACVSAQSGTFTASSTINAPVSLPDESTADRAIIAAVQEDLYSFNIWQDDPPVDVFSISITKRGLDSGDLLDGAKYKLYAYDSSGEWVEHQSKSVENGVALFDGIETSSSANGTFRIVESAMVNSEYQMDSTFEAIVNPSTGEWWYNSAFTGQQHGTEINGDVTAAVDLKNGSSADKVIISGHVNSSSRYDFGVFQDDARKTNHNLTVEKVVYVNNEAWPVSGMTFMLQKQTGSSWTDVGTLEPINTSVRPGEYQIPKDGDDNWLYPMESGATYRIIEREAPKGVINSGWTSQPFQWNPYVDMDLSFTAEDFLPTGHIGIQKRDSETNAPIEGASFTITAAEDIIDTVGSNSITWYHAGEIVAVELTNANGRILIVDLPYGKYTVTETNHPSNYAYDNVSFTVTVGAPSGYSGSTAYTNPMIGYATYPSGMNVTTADGLCYVTVGNTPIHPDMAVAKLTERTTNPSGSAVTFDAATGRYTQTKVPGTYYNGQAAKFTLTATNTGDVDLFNVRLVDVFSEALWPVVKKQTGSRTTDVTFRQVNNTPLALGNALAVGNTVTTSHGKTAKVTAISYNDATRTYEITFDKLEPGDSVSLQITFTLYNSLNINQQNLPNDVYLYTQYLINGTTGKLEDTPGGGEGDCHDLDKLNVVSQGSLTIHKQDAEENPLEDVHFTLFDGNGDPVSFVHKSNGDYAATVTKENGDWVSAATSGQATTTDLVTDNSGTITITGLPEDSYTLVETQTVPGQTLLAEPFTFDLPLLKPGSELHLDGNVYFDGVNHLYSLDCTITNTAQFKLPATGFFNTMPLLSTTGAALLFTAFILVRKRRKAA